MAKIYYIKNVPSCVLNYFNIKFPTSSGFTYEFYKYYNSDKTVTYYGCFVRLNGELYSYSDQDTEQGFNEIPQPVIVN
jgi:hypothetical protein